MEKQTKQFKRAGYDQTLKFLMKEKSIYFIDCTCGDFIHRRIKRDGQYSDLKFYAEPCKHLRPLVEFYQKIHGFQLKEPKPMIGTDKCTAILRNTLILRSEGRCEAKCGKEGKTVHRKIRGSNGGKYNESNCVFICAECHKLAHGNEFSGVKGK